MTDKNDRFSLRDHRTQDLEQAFNFLRRQDGGWFVHDEHVRAPIKHLEQFHPLLLAHRKLPYFGLRIDFQSKPFSNGGNFFIILVKSHQESWVIQPKEDIFRNRLGWDKHKMLVDHADARLD